MGINGLDCHLNVNIEWDTHGANPPTKNELDVLFTYQNRLHVISCKTSNMNRSKDGPEPPKGKETLYELDSLTKASGGLLARPMLVSVHPLRPEDFQRAREQKIKVICGSAILQLQERLENHWKLKAAP